MPLPVITDVFRVAWVGSGRKFVNVMHVKAPGATDAQVFAAMDAVFAANTATTNLLRDLESGLSVVSVEIIKLDGVSPTQIFTPTTWGGSGAGEIIPNQASIISLRTGVRGPRGRGRLFIGPIGESVVNNGRLVSGRPAQNQTNWAAFANALIANTPSMALGVASYAHADWNQVTTITCPEKVGNQIRRLHAA